MKTNPVRAKLQRGEPSIGTWLTLSDPTAAQLMATAGFDWLTVELEHSPTTMESAAHMFGLIAATGCVPLARVAENTIANIKLVLDSGAWGVIVPMVNSRAEAEAAVKAARYFPLGDRSVGGSLRAVAFGTDAATYHAKANDEVLLIVMAEHVKAVADIDAILSTPGIDAVFVGPNDLHASMGLPPAFESGHAQFNDALATILASARKHGIPAGIHVADAAQAARRVKEGWQFIAVASESGFMLAKAGEIVKALGLGAGQAVAKY